jgi:hypothetical protein
LICDLFVFLALNIIKYENAILYCLHFFPIINYK